MCKGCHVVVVGTRVKSLAALKAACARLGFAFAEGQGTYKWFGRWVNDYHADDAAYKQGVAVEDYGKCEHAIKVPGCEYEVGVVRRGDEYGLIFDCFDGHLTRALGGKGMPRLLQAYAAEAAIEQARFGCTTFSEQTLEDGSIQLRVRVNE